MNRLDTQLALRYPIVQAPMAGVQDSRLAIAVCQAGGLGSLPAAMLSPQQLAEQLTQIQQADCGPYNVNFFCHTPPDLAQVRLDAWHQRLAPFLEQFEIAPESLPTQPSRQPYSHEMAQVLAPFAPPVVSFHFGLPERLAIEQIKGWGGLVMSSATTVEEARWLEDNGADIIIAQGLEAGGHRGMFLNSNLDSQLGSFALLPQILAAVDCPVIAAGGIASAEGVQAMLTLGASGVQVGTSYLLCDETNTSELHRQAIKESHRPTVVTNVFSGRPARGIANTFTQALGPICPEAPQFPLASNASGVLRSAAEAENSSDFTPLWSGQNRTGCLEIPAAAMTEHLASLL